MPTPCFLCRPTSVLLHRRERRQSKPVNTAGDASEDGDFVALRESREVSLRPRSYCDRSVSGTATGKNRATLIQPPSDPSCPYG
ncbi:hypothetical protein ElyMa_004273700 [Elysia marginata]|uniref:Uncharacterized protein n=1 Tax=Elysia marginata TaxID=1093978 RepID=A0AAV4GVS3_9GAST|nr:hypothetical protein ElyMa_004273700 [Elysia marginata]